MKIWRNMNHIRSQYGTFKMRKCARKKNPHKNGTSSIFSLIIVAKVWIDLNIVEKLEKKKINFCRFSFRYCQIFAFFGGTNDAHTILYEENMPYIRSMFVHTNTHLYTHRTRIHSHA